MKDLPYGLHNVSRLDSKTAPSKVFYNHFWAIAKHLRFETNRYSLKQVTYFNNLKSKNERLDVDYIKKLLWNSWSTEYAFKISATVNSDDYYKFALHWNFPQAYYSVYLAMTAFQYTQKIDSNQHEKSIKSFGNSVKDGHYPKVISFYVSGLHEEFTYYNLDLFHGFPKAFSQLKNINTQKDVHTQIASFLKSTRIKNAGHKKDRLKLQNDSRFFNKKDVFTGRMSKKHWDIIYSTLPQATILHLLYRLRIKANYQDIETFIHAEIDFRQFHEHIGELIFYLNYIHESYVLKVIGESAYQKILNDFSKHLNEDTAVSRYNLMKDNWLR